MTWTKPLSGFIRQAEGDLNREFRATALQALVGVVERSPVDQGTFRANNFLTIGEVTTAFFEDITDPSGQATIAAGEAVLRQVQGPYNVAYIQNRLPYAEPLEEGSSSQAPQGVYAITLNNLKEGA